MTESTDDRHIHRLAFLCLGSFGGGYGWLVVVVYDYVVDYDDSE